MKSILSLLIFFVFPLSMSAQSFEELMNSGKTELAKQDSGNNYEAAASKFEQALQLNPSHVEALYALGLAYDKLNEKHERLTGSRNAGLTEKASMTFEKIIQKPPIVRPEMMATEPYTMISKVWYSLALSYLYTGKNDSANQALSEAKQRGGIGDYFEARAKLMFDLCLPGSILLSSGVLNSLPLVYVQRIKNYRTDVTVVDIEKLNNAPYPVYLFRNKSVLSEIPTQVLDTLQKVSWKDSLISIPIWESKQTFKWTVRPTLDSGYLSRSNYILLDILKTNQFVRPVYFTKGLQENDLLNLENKVRNMLILNKVIAGKEAPFSFMDFEKIATDALNLTELADKNSNDQMAATAEIRVSVLKETHFYLSGGKKQYAQKLFETLEKKMPKKKYPYETPDLEKFAKSIRNKL